ncbi:hypothetical protein [Paraburkholderia solitsugae]|uniref:hypothetical protein n=1 Tax=Paraburkholderia solitsugae TaxID=2675748 RepID=UPI002E28B6F2|nr:hypothetical protein [Paraburkholderia solitsugae]
MAARADERRGTARGRASLHEAGAPGKPYVSQLCRQLGLRPPWPVRAAVTGDAAHIEVGDCHLAAIRQILARPQVETRRAAG